MSETVLVGCKYPNGFVLPPLKDSPEGFEGYELAGAYTHRSFNPAHGMLHSIAFGSTPVPKDYWDKFVVEYKGLAALKKGLLFAQENKAELKAEAKDKESLTPGLSGADPEAKGSGVQRAKLK